MRVVVQLLLLSAVAAGQAHAQTPRSRTSAPAPPAFSPDSGPRKPVRPTRSCVVERITDGDTFACKDVGRVRLIGIDAPEKDQRPTGAQSTAALSALMPVGSTVEIELDVQPQDIYQRTLAYVWAKGRMVNWVMIRSGWTVLLTIPPDVQYADEFRKAQDQARRERLGHWKDDGFACLPADHRRKKC